MADSENDLPPLTEAETRSILGVFDDRRYARLAIDARPGYTAADPFPHAVFDDFLPASVADAVSREYPLPGQTAERWKLHDNDNVRRYFLEDVGGFSPRLRLFATALCSRDFLLFLETLTGIEALLPDPYFMGGGAMVTETGGFLKVHVDFNWHQKIQAWRRLNALFYLTPEWREEWGGNLELWSRDGRRKVTEIVPRFNRLVVFNTTSTSYHGQPDPIRAPGRTRRCVFSAFYYATRRTADIDDHPHFTRYPEGSAAGDARFETSPYAEAISRDYRSRAD